MFKILENSVSLEKPQPVTTYGVRKNLGQLQEVAFDRATITNAQLHQTRDLHVWDLVLITYLF